jgi:hypothetical protein
MLGNILGIVFLVGSIYLITRSTPEVTQKELTPWNHQLGTTNSLKSNGNRDASMIIQSVRRSAIAAVHRGGYRPIKETTHTTGSTSGYLEAYMITSDCPCPPKPCPDILDGQLSGSEICDIYDGNLQGAVYDGGNSRTLVCNQCDAPPDTVFDGMAGADEVCVVADGTVPNGMPYDGGSSRTLVCGS